jgi:hypothetical protein
MMMDPGSDVVDDGLISTPSDSHRLLHNNIQSQQCRPGRVDLWETVYILHRRLSKDCGEHIA